MKVRKRRAGVKRRYSHILPTDEAHYWRGHRHYHCHHRRVSGQGDTQMIGLPPFCSLCPSVAPAPTRLVYLHPSRRGPLLCYIYARGPNSPSVHILFGADSRVFVGFERTILPDLLLASASPAREVFEIYQGSDLQSRHVQTSVLYPAELRYVFHELNVICRMLLWSS